MKTQKITSGKNGFTVLSMATAIIFLMASCQKDQLPNPLNAANANTILSSNRSSKPSPYIPAYAMITIMHDGGHSISNPGYSVTAYSNGIAVFNGYRNVAKIGEVKFQLSKDQLLAVETEINKSRFLSIADDLTYIPDAPYVTTTCTISLTPKTDVTNADVVNLNPADRSITKSLIDYNEGYPASLIALRTEVENTLNISMYVHGDHDVNF